jgi:Cys-tRNA(Pro)/Cys-tRNA(Cys) deacylase
MAKKDDKTNVMRVLEQKNIPYTPHEYSTEDGALSGVDVAAALGKAPYEIYKTLVTRGASGGYYVFVIPGEDQLDLKKAAKAAGEKSIAMIKQAELLPLTGYIHGGCSPVGMKKQFPTFFQEDVVLLDTVTVSAGKVGYQIETAPTALMELVGAETADVTVS